MNNKHYDIVWTNQFKKDYKLAMKRHLDIETFLMTSSVSWQAANSFQRRIKTTL